MTTTHAPETPKNKPHADLHDLHAGGPSRTPPPLKGGGVRSQPVLWRELITQIHHFTHHTGLGLANTWAHIHHNDYPAALHSFTTTRDAWHHDHKATR